MTIERGRQRKGDDNGEEDISGEGMTMEKGTSGEIG